jgi:hypothetical protein
MSRYTPLLAALILTSSACIENSRRSSPLDTTSDADDVAADVADVSETDADEPDADEPDAEVAETVEVDADAVEVDADVVEVADADVVEVEDTDVEVEVVQLACLPAGCVEPGSGCALSSGFCWIEGRCVAGQEVDPHNECRYCEPSSSPRAWKSVGDGKECDDGLTCTKGDICRQGLCGGETDCPSALSCLTPVCDPSENACVNQVDAGRCYYGGQCHSAGEVTQAGCSHCDPTLNRDGATPGDGNEPDDTLDFGNPLTFNELTVTTGTNNDPAWNGPWTSSTLSPILDIDVFGFTFPSSGVFTKPVFKLSQASAVEVEVCVYVRCLPEADQSTRPITNVTCSGSDTKKSVDGWVGCCRARTELEREQGPSQSWCIREGTMVATRAEAAATIRRIVPPATPECHPYSLRWGMR